MTLTVEPSIRASRVREPINDVQGPPRVADPALTPHAQASHDCRPAGTPDDRSRR
jgi:hypothetical protein